MGRDGAMIVSIFIHLFETINNVLIERFTLVKIGITYANCHFCVGCICIHKVVVGLSWSKAAFFSMKQCCLIQYAKDNEKVLILYSKIKQFCYEGRKNYEQCTYKKEVIDFGRMAGARSFAEGLDAVHRIR